MPEWRPHKSGVTRRATKRNAPAIVVTAAGVAVFPPRATFGPRTLSDFEFVWIMEGNVVAHFDGQRVEAGPGTVILARPGMTDQYEWDRERRTIHGYFHFTIANQRRWPPFDRWPLARTMPEDDVIRPLFRYVLKLTAEPSACAADHVASVVEVMLGAFLRGSLALAPEPIMTLPVAVERALQAIHDAVYAPGAEEITLDALAARACVTRQHLCRLFRQHLQLGPMETLRLMRAQSAATLLGRTTMSVKEIAEATGFANPFHLSRVFRQTYGLSPQQYRTALWGGVPLPINPVAERLRFAVWSLRVPTNRMTSITTPQNPPLPKTPAPKSGDR
ncbi:MAG: helix-turn-helix domain-containing protein [Verrucomicrobiae bacterium]|nr:helix-turn-helix domain-containing protein [Verrucomicrobiae bacterium]